MMKSYLFATALCAIAMFSLQLLAQNIQTSDAGILKSKRIEGDNTADFNSDSAADSDSKVNVAVNINAGLEEMDTLAIEEAILKLAQSKSNDAKKKLRKYNYPAALEIYAEAYDLDPENPEIVNSYGYVFFLLGNFEEAERLYREAIVLDPVRFVAYINLADLIIEKSTLPQQLDEASRLLVKAREIKGNRPKLILRQARVAAKRLEYEEAQRFYNEYLALRKPNNKLRLEIGDFNRDLGRTEKSLEWYRQVEGDELARQAAGRIWEIEVEKQSKQFGWTKSTKVISQKAQKIAQRGYDALQKHKYAESQRFLLEALALAPTFATARARLGDLQAQQGKMLEAELSYLRALAVDHSNPEINARLGKLYLQSHDKSRSAEAAVFFFRSLELRPDWTELHLQLAIALRRSGDPLEALVHIKNYLLKTNEKDINSAALALKRSIEAVLPPEALIETDVIKGAFLQHGQKISDELSQTLASAKVHLSHGNLDSAMADLRGLPVADRGVLVLNLEARILLGAGKTEEAITILMKSLRLDDKQEIIYEQLGLALLEVGQKEECRIHLLRAEELGGLTATYLIAKIDADKSETETLSIFRDLMRLSDLLGAQTRINKFLNTATASIYWDEAEAIKQNIKNRLNALLAAVIILLLVVLIALAIVWRQIWGGINLKTLIEKCPETGIQVQQVLSAVRHEVLKHNTMMLEGLVKAIEKGEDVKERIAHFKISILGDKSQGGVNEKLEYYVEQLHKIGNANRKRLNLSRKDAAMTPLINGMKLLNKSLSGLDKYIGLNAGNKAKLLKNLQIASQLLNTKGYEAVRGLLDKLRILEVDRLLIKSIYDKCVKEPSFAAVSFEPLKLNINLSKTDGLLGIQVPRGAFEDIMTNLIRNAIQSSLLYGEERDHVCIGLSVESEIDLITGIERIVFMVHDKAHKILTPEMLRGRYIEEGLGLTADLVSRYDGTLDVLASDKSWSKSVIVKLPRAER